MKKLLKMYYSLPVTVTPREFLNGHGNWGLTQKEYNLAEKIAKLIVNQ